MKQTLLRLRWRIVLVGCVILLGVCSAGPWPAASAPKENRIVQLGPERNLADLFLHDDFLVAQTEGLVLATAKVRKHPANPVLVKDRPWEQGMLNYTCVIQDPEEGLYKMWYQMIRPLTGRNESWCLYAESKDGVRWDKPSLGIVEFQGSKQNNILFHEYENVTGTPSYWVTKDYAEPDPQKRYKMMLQAWDFRGRSARIAFSPDGIHWTIPKYGNLLGPFDSQNIMFWDERVGRYVGYFRSHVGGRRSISRATSSDGFHWSRPVTVHTPDAQDPPTWHLYTPGIFPYTQARNTYVMITAGFDEVSHTMYGQLGLSRDGIEWRRFRKPFIPLGKPGEWDSGSNYAIGSEITVEGQTAIYYKGSNKPAHSYDSDRGIGLALLHEGGFVGRRAENEGTLVTHLLRVRDDHCAFYLNADAEGGAIQAELLDAADKVIPGFSRQDCEEINRKGTNLRVRWKGADGPHLPKCRCRGRGNSGRTTGRGRQGNPRILPARL